MLSTINFLSFRLIRPNDSLEKKLSLNLKPQTYSTPKIQSDSKLDVAILQFIFVLFQIIIIPFYSLTQPLLHRKLRVITEQ